MSENRKKNQIQNTNLENFDDEDLWEIQSKKEDYINKSLELEMTADLIENLPLELPINNQEVDSINENLALENITETKELEEKNIEILKQENINSIPENNY